MNIHEYQAKELLAKFGVPVPAGYPAMSVEEAVAAAQIAVAETRAVLERLDLRVVFAVVNEDVAQAYRRALG